MSQFFADEEMVEYTPELKELYQTWCFLTPEQKDAILHVMKAMQAQ